MRRPLFIAPILIPLLILGLSLPSPVFGLRPQPARSGLEQELHRAAGLEELEKYQPQRMVGISREMQQFLLQLGKPSLNVFSHYSWSTQLMLEAMELVQSIFPNAELLDTGAGSGVLGVAALVVPGFEVSHVTATDVHEYSLQHARTIAEQLAVLNRYETHPGSLLDPVSGRQFDVALFNAPTVTTAENYISFVGPALKPDGVALLMWYSRSEKSLRDLARKEDLAIVPILEDPYRWRVYALAHRPERLQLLLGLIQKRGRPSERIFEPHLVSKEEGGIHVVIRMLWRETSGKVAHDRVLLNGEVKIFAEEDDTPEMLAGDVLRLLDPHEGPFALELISDGMAHPRGMGTYVLSIRTVPAGLEEAKTVEVTPEMVQARFTGGFRATGKAWPIRRPKQLFWVTPGLLGILHGDLERNRLRFVSVTPDSKPSFLLPDGLGHGYKIPTFVAAGPERRTGASDTRQLILFNGPEHVLDHFDVEHAWRGSLSFVKELHSTASQTHSSEFGTPAGAVFDPTPPHGGRYLFLYWTPEHGWEARTYLNWQLFDPDETYLIDDVQLKNPSPPVYDPVGKRILLISEVRKGVHKLYAFSWGAGFYKKTSPDIILPKLPDIDSLKFTSSSLRLAVDPRTGELLVATPSGKVLVFGLKDSGGYLNDAPLRSIVDLHNVLTLRPSEPWPIPITVQDSDDAKRRRLLVGNPRDQGEVLVVPAPSVLTAPPEATIFTKIHQEKLPRPTLGQVWGASHFWWAGYTEDGRWILRVWDLTRHMPLEALVDPNLFSARQPIPLRWRGVTGNPPLFRPHFVRRGPWGIVAKMKEKLGTALSLSAHLYREGVSIRPGHRVLYPPHDSGIHLHPQDEIWLSGKVEPDSDQRRVRFYVLIQSESGWNPVLLEARAVLGKTKIRIEEIRWQKQPDLKYLRGMVMDSEGLPWAYRRRDLSDANDGGELVPLTTSFPAFSGGLEEMEAMPEALSGELNGTSWAIRDEADGGKTIWMPAEHPMPVDLASPPAALYLQAGLEIPYDLPKGVNVVTFGAGLEEALQAWRTSLHPWDAIVYNGELTPDPKETIFHAWIPLVSSRPALLRMNPQILLGMTFSRLALLAQMARQQGYVLDVKSITYRQVGDTLFAIIRAA